MSHVDGAERWAEEKRAGKYEQTDQLSSFQVCVGTQGLSETIEVDSLKGNSRRGCQFNKLKKADGTTKKGECF